MWPLLAVAPLVACASRPAARPPLAVQVETVGQATFNPSIEVISRLESTANVALRPETDGRVVQILARDGQRVRAGQPILVLDNVQDTAQLDASRAEASRDFVNAQRYIFLNQQGAVSTKDRDYYVTQAIKSRESVKANAATLGYKYVTAPINGEIGNLDMVKPGDFVHKGQAISGIVDNSQLWTLMDIPATQAGRVRIGQPVQIISQGDPPVAGIGKVVFISPYYGVSGETSSPNTVLVKAVFPNLTGKLKTGQYVRNRVITGSLSQLSLPVQAVMMQAQQPFVYRVVPLALALPKIRASDTIPAAQKAALEKLPPTSSIVVQTPVQLGVLQQSRYPLLAGLSAGDTVVVSNTALLRSGMPVRFAAATGN